MQLLKDSVLNTYQIDKHYKHIQALRQVSFDVPKGSIFGILGPNGSGKTTLLGVIMDVLKPSSGTYQWFGETPNAAQRKRIGTLLETPNFYHYLSAVDNLKISAAIKGISDSRHIHTVLEKVNLGERKYTKFSTFSLGMKQRLAIAACLLGNPDIIVFDEPTNGLDPVGIVDVRTIIKQLASEGKTIIMSSHLLDEVEKVCTHVAILQRGKLLSCGSVQQILTGEDIVEVSCCNIDKLKSIIATISGCVRMEKNDNTLLLYFASNTASLEHINKTCFENNIILTHLTLKKHSLESKFFELTSIKN